MLNVGLDAAGAAGATGAAGAADAQLEMIRANTTIRKNSFFCILSSPEIEIGTIFVEQTGNKSYKMVNLAFASSIALLIPLSIRLQD
jgi:hypothetical protein